MQVREESGPDSVYWLGSAKHSNEQAYLFRKFAGYWGTNNVDHQARICHSTTVAGVANTWGYGAMTNSYNDIHNSQAQSSLSAATQRKPIRFRCLHVLRAKEQNNAPLIVCDPRVSPGLRRMPMNMSGSARVQRCRRSSGVSSGTFSRMAGKTRNSSGPVSGEWTRFATRWRNGIRPRKPSG